jgi:hypothetical protein
MNSPKRSRSRSPSKNSSLKNPSKRKKDSLSFQQGNSQIRRKLFDSEPIKSRSSSLTQPIKSRSSSLTQPIKSRSSSLTPTAKIRSSSLTPTQEIMYSPKKTPTKNKSSQFSPNKNPYEELIKKKKVVWYEPTFGRYVTIDEMYREYDQFEKNKKYMNSLDDLFTWSPSPKKRR